MIDTALQQFYAEAVSLLLRWVAIQTQGGDGAAMSAEAEVWLAAHIEQQSHWPKPHARGDWFTEETRCG